MKLPYLLSLAICLSPFASLAQSPSPVPVELSVSATEPGRVIPEEFSGLSFEMQRLLPDDKGQYYFRPDNVSLLALFRTLGIKSLRIGGNTADRPKLPFPSTADIDQLFAFARKANVKVIFTLRLREGDPKVAGAVAKHVMDHYPDLIWCFAIGNEPNVFAPEYPKFVAAWKKFADVVNSPKFAPTARFAGPSSTAGKTGWTRDFAREFAGTGRLLVATQHIYPGGNSDLVKDAATGRDLMLSTGWIKDYQKFYDSFGPDVLETGIPYRLGETNSFWNGGKKDVSDTFAAALWALDYLHWWAAHGANGLNFHTGDFVAKKDENTRCMYSAFWSTEHGYEAKPVAYALATFDLVRHGHLLTTTIASNPQNLNLTAYATRTADALCHTLINKEYGVTGRAANVTITTRGGAVAQVIRLATADGDVTRTEGYLLGDSAIAEDGTWNGKWTASAPADASGKLVITVPAASAVIVKIPDASLKN